MKSPENFSPRPAKIEKIETEGKGITQKSPEIEITEISNEQLRQHAESTETYIDQQTSEILPEAEKRIESFTRSVNISAELLVAAREEYGLDAQLQEIQREANQIGQEAKLEVAQVMQEMPPVKVAKKQQMPEELREERLMAIIKELEKEWELTHGAMYRPLSQREIEKNKEMARLWGKEWDGRTTQMTDAASEFFFDHKGMGKNSVPSRAEKILMERFPEYAKKQEEKQEQSKKEPTKIPENQFVQKTPERTPGAINSPAEKLSGIFEQLGIESKVIKIEDGGEFSEAIIFGKKEVPDEKLVRLYRGVSHLDSSVLEQIPYAMRTEKGTGKPAILENVRQEVEALAKNPTYENLIAYTDKVRSNLTPEEARRLHEDLKRIEDGILDGYSTRKELIMRQIEHSGGWGESGISPYISCSFDPHEAAGYGREGLIIMDVPLSQIEDFRADATETNIKGALDKKYITAILLRKREGDKEKEQVNQELYRALQKVYENTSAVLYEGEELRAEREKIQTEQAEGDKEQWKKDVEKVRQKRVNNLTRRFPEVKLNLQNAAEQGVDIYTKAKRDIFDFYKTRLEKIGRKGRNIEDYEYQESDYGERKKFDREKINEIMLLRLKILVDQLEEREKEGSKR